MSKESIREMPVSKKWSERLRDPSAHEASPAGRTVGWKGLQGAHQKSCVSPRNRLAVGTTPFAGTSAWEVWGGRMAEQSARGLRAGMPLQVEGCRRVLMAPRAASFPKFPSYVFSVSSFVLVDHIL